MSKGIRALLGLGMWLAIYLLAVYAVPSIGPIEQLVETTAWLGNGEISQATFLMISLILIFILARGNLAIYGLQGARVRQLVKPVVVAVAVCLLFFILSAIAMMATGPPGEGPGGSAMNKGLLNFILTVVVWASICEEIFNRGLVQGFLSPLKQHGFKLLRTHISLPVIICGLLFGLGHLCLLGDMDSRMVVLIIISATALGFIAGYFRERTNSLIPAIAVHMTFNIVTGVIPQLLRMAMAGGVS